MTLMDCIERIPGKLTEIAGRNVTIDGKMAAAEELIIIASGSSYNATFTAKLFLEKICGIKTTLFYPNMFVNYNTDIRKNAAYLFISQGGQTKLVYEAMLLAKKDGCYTYAMTAEKDCIIARDADCWLDMGCGKEEYRFRTLGFSATAASVMMLGAALAFRKGILSEEAYGQLRKDLVEAARNLEQIRIDTLAWYEKNKFPMLRRDTVLFVGAGELWPVAQESDIKAMEMIPAMTKSYELEEFIHGPQNAFHNGMLFILFSKAGEDEEKVRKIAAFLKQEIGFCAVIGAVADENNERDLKLEIRSRYFAPLEYITFGQVFAYKMAEARGRDLTESVNSVIQKYIQKTI